MVFSLIIPFRCTSTDLINLVPKNRLWDNDNTIILSQINKDIYNLSCTFSDIKSIFYEFFTCLKKLISFM